MNRTDRLLGIVLELQARKSQRAEDLAETFGVTRRTIYRDMQALCEAGVPVVALPGQGYQLVEGYFLPPLSFSADEALMLLLGSDFAAQNFDAQYRAAALSAASKIEAVLPDHLRAEIEYLKHSIRFIVCGLTDSLDALWLLRRAILEHRRVHFFYHARFPADGHDQGQPREVDPYALVHVSGRWLLMGYCHLRRGMRNFRLDRMSDLSELDRAFIRPASWRIEPKKGDDRTLVVRALFDPAVARWVHESATFFKESEEERPDGLLVTLRVRQEDEVFQWLFGWGAHVRVLEPESLRARMAREAAEMLRRHVDAADFEPLESMLT